MAQLLTMAGSKQNSLRKKFTEHDIRNAGIPILMLNIPKSAKIHAIDTSCEDVFNNEDVQACAKESWRTTPQNLKRAKLILVTKKLDKASAYTREILGVFEYSDVEKDNNDNNEEYRRIHFVDIRPASEEWSCKFKDGLIVGLNPRATNPLRYFLGANKNKTNKK